MNKCNYCTLAAIKRVAANAGASVELVDRSTDFAPAGVDVFITYPEPAWAAWFMQLPDHCVC